MNTIRGRLIALLAAGLTVVLLIGGALMYVVAREGLMRQLDEGLESRARALAALVTFDDGRIEFEFDEGEDEPVRDGWFEYRTAGGKSLRRSRRLDEAGLPSVTLQEKEVVHRDVAISDAINARAAWFAFEPREVVDDPSAGETKPNEPLLVVCVAVDLAPMNRVLTTLLATLVGVGAVVAMTMVGLVAVGVRVGLRPLERLRQRLERFDGEAKDGELSEDRVPGELKPVYAALDEMLGRVERTIDRERSFSDAAAHEFRTPLAELRARVEVAKRWPDEHPPTMCYQDVLEITTEMERLIDALLGISRAGAQALDDVMEDVAIRELVERALERERPTIERKQLEVRVDVDASAHVRTSRAGLEIIVRNLINNAVEHTPPPPTQGRVHVLSGADGGDAAVVEVRNGPVELTNADVARLFEPFWRQDASRTHREHMGLGLTVVERMARVMGMRVEAKLDGEWLVMRVMRTHN